MSGTQDPARDTDQLDVDDGTQHTSAMFIRDISPLSAIADSDPRKFLSEEAALRQEARDLAEAVREQYATSNTLAVDVFGISEKMGLPVFERLLNMESVKQTDATWVSGVLEKLKGNDFATIYVEARDPLVRQRFSAAHEIWHWLTHIKGRTPEEIRSMEFWDVREPEGEITISEYSGDMFAHMLLLPRYAVQSELASGYSLRAMAERALVSQRTMENRLRQLALIGI